jgi:hypothetical protein
LEEAEERLAQFTTPNLHVGQAIDLTAFLKREEERERQRKEERQEFLQARKEQEAWGYEMRAMTDTVATLWERTRLQPTSVTTSTAPTPTSPTVAPTLLTIAKITDGQPAKSLSPADILERHASPKDIADPAESTAEQPEESRAAGLPLAACESKEAASGNPGKQFDITDVLNVPSDHETDTQHAMFVEPTEHTGDKQMDAIVALANALTAAGICGSSTDTIMADPTTSSAPSSSVVPAQATLPEDSMAIERHENSRESDVCPPPDVPPTTEKLASVPEDTTVPVDDQPAGDSMCVDEVPEAQKPAGSEDQEATGDPGVSLGRWLPISHNCNV